MSKMPKVIAMYLPQFHRVKENDEWWGEGFTDWISTKDAKPVFEGHYQPHVPQNKNYYDLLEKSTMQWQANLMQQYGVDGMCIYHYWFKDGRRILEKPAENLLKWTDIDMPFCFCWANETWARSWSHVRGSNVWTNVHEKDEENTGRGILLEQKYGEEEQWKEHFFYLLPFLRDTRYIKCHNKPVIVIYKPDDIACLNEMIEYWQRLAAEAGLVGLYIIGANCGSNLPRELDAELYHEPIRSRRQLLEFKTENQAFVIEYKDVWNRILNADKGERKTYFGGFVGYDDTPRRGKEGIVVNNATPSQFQYYLTELMAKNLANGSEFVFINAWNEWGEGMHLEPDEKYGTSFLAAIKDAKKNYANSVDKYIQSGCSTIREDVQIQKRCDKFEKYLNLLDDWMCLKEQGIHLDKYLTERGIEKIAVYGCGIFGRHLIEELKNSGVEIVCVIDKQKDKLHLDIPTYLPGEKLPDCDAIVVTAFYFYEDIKNILKEYQYDIISIETVIRESNLL